MPNFSNIVLRHQRKKLKNQPTPESKERKWEKELEDYIAPEPQCFGNAPTPESSPFKHAGGIPSPHNHYAHTNTPESKDGLYEIEQFKMPAKDGTTQIEEILEQVVIKINEIINHLKKYEN